MKMKEQEQINDEEEQNNVRSDESASIQQEDKFLEEVHKQIGRIKQYQYKVLKQGNLRRQKIDSTRRQCQQLEFGITLIKLLACLQFVESQRDDEDYQDIQVQRKMIKRKCSGMMVELEKTIEMKERTNRLEEQISQLESCPQSQDHNEQESQSVSIGQRIGIEQNKGIKLIKKSEGLPQIMRRQQYPANYSNSYLQTNYYQLMNPHGYQCQPMMSQPSFTNNHPQSTPNYQINPNYVHSYPQYIPNQNPSAYPYYPQYAQGYSNNSSNFNNSQQTNWNPYLSQYPVMYPPVYTQNPNHYPDQNVNQDHNQQ